MTMDVKEEGRERKDGGGGGGRRHERERENKGLSQNVPPL